MRHPLSTHSLKWVIIPVLLFIQIAVFSVIAWQSVRVLQDMATEQTRLRVRTLQTELQAALIAPLLERDFVTLQEIAQELTQGGDLAYLIISDSAGKELARAGLPGNVSPQSRGIARNKDNDDIFDTAINISQGTVYVGLHRAEAGQILTGFARRTGPTIVAGLCIATLWMIWVTLWLSRRLDILTRAADALGQGNLLTRAPESQHDEIGRLGEAFNRMAAAVQSADENWAKSQRFADMLLMAIPIPVFYKDAQGRFLGCNAAFTRATGFSRIDIRGKTTAELWTDDVAAIHRLHDDGLLQGQSHLDYPGTILTHSGQIRQVILSKDVFFNDMGEIAGIIGAWNDITEQKQAEARLRLLADVFKHSHEGIIIADNQARLIDVNHACCVISGYDREELIGHTPRKLQSGRHDREFYQQLRNKLQHSGHWQGEVWNRRKNGEVYPLLLSISSIRTPDGDVSNYIAVFADISVMKAQEARLAQLAHHDPLTHLPNRVLLADRMKVAIAQAQHSGKWLAICFMDLDGFKAVNDCYGHEMGDRLLVQIAERLHGTLLGGDTLARLGGDEFVLLLSGLPDLQACRHQLQRVLDTVAQPVMLGDVQIDISASIGVTLYPQDEQDPDTLLRHADQAMYQAKEKGRNGYQIFDAEHDRQSRSKHESLHRLQDALHNGELCLYYQPKVNMRDGRVIGAEALMRWQHPVKGLLTPAHFLDDAEGSELDVELGEWVIRSALSQMTQWQQQALPLPVSVNISAHHLQQHDFAERLRDILAEFPTLPPSMLEIEVLESTALKDITRVGNLMTTCRELGVEFSLDDFGTGYSSLLYLKRLPAHKLKIDQSFIRDMHEDGDDLAIVQGIIGLSDAFSRTVIAEGVETIEHGSLLLHIGCDNAQGYGIARPMPAEQIQAWAQNWQSDSSWKKASQRRWTGDDSKLFNLEIAHRHSSNQLIEWLKQGMPESALPEPANSYRDFDTWYHGAGNAYFQDHRLYAETGHLHQKLFTISERLLTWRRVDSSADKATLAAELETLRNQLQQNIRSMLADTLPAARKPKQLSETMI